MNLADTLYTIDQLQRDIRTLPELSPVQRARLWDRIRLDWNYHSNAIEGNTLTLSETNILLTQGIHAGNKLGKHYEEMQRHDRVLSYVKDLITHPDDEAFVVNEKFIRELHVLLMGEEYDLSAEDPFGKPTRVRKRAGVYKTNRNYVLRAGGERYYYTPPEKVGPEMSDLIAWLTAERQKEEPERLHPVLVASVFHLRFVTIHPFDDGNGRMGRLLMNILLMQARLAPAVIEREERRAYFAALVAAQSGLGERDAFYELSANGVLKGMELRLKAYKGESLARLDDWKKEALLLQQQITHIHQTFELKRSLETIRTVCQQLHDTLFLRLKTETGEAFGEVFNHKDARYNIEGRSTHLPIEWPLLSDLINEEFVKQDSRLDFELSFCGYKIPSFEYNNKYYTIRIGFDEYYYSIQKIYSEQLISVPPNLFRKRRYDQPLLETEADELIAAIGKDLNRDIQEKLQQYRDARDS